MCKRTSFTSRCERGCKRASCTLARENASLTCARMKASECTIRLPPTVHRGRAQVTVQGPRPASLRTGSLQSCYLWCKRRMQNAHVLLQLYIRNTTVRYHSRRRQCTGGRARRTRTQQGNRTYRGTKLATRDTGYCTERRCAWPLEGVWFIVYAYEDSYQQACTPYMHTGATGDCGQGWAWNGSILSRV
jgi:hypothetical protein